MLPIIDCNDRIPGANRLTEIGKKKAFGYLGQYMQYDFIANDGENITRIAETLGVSRRTAKRLFLEYMRKANGVGRLTIDFALTMTISRLEKMLAEIEKNQDKFKDPLEKADLELKIFDRMIKYLDWYPPNQKEP